MSPEAGQALEVDDRVDEKVHRREEEGEEGPPPQKQVHCGELPELLVNAGPAHVAAD